MFDGTRVSLFCFGLRVKYTCNSKNNFLIRLQFALRKNRKQGECSADLLSFQGVADGNGHSTSDQSSVSPVPVTKTYGNYYAIFK